jgi:hypothetical protein
MPTMSIRATALAALAGLALAGAGAAQAAEPFAFGLWGDMPYAKANDQPKIAPLIAAINASDIALSLYDGDIKDGSSKCTDDVYTDAIQMFDSLRVPLVYVPGDNEWTDCHRSNNGGYDNLERLDHLREVMFKSPESFGATKLALDHQGKPGGKFAENTRFTYGGIVFVGLNIPGSNNNKVSSDKECTSKSARTPAQCAADDAEYAERDATNLAWMQEAFAQAKQDGAPGIVLVLQADPGFDLPETEDTTSASPRPSTATPPSSTSWPWRPKRFPARSCWCTATRTSSSSTSRCSARTICSRTSPASRPSAARTSTGSR